MADIEDGIEAKFKNEEWVHNCLIKVYMFVNSSTLTFLKISIDPTVM